jgi:hypothetical protein
MPIPSTSTPGPTSISAGDAGLTVSFTQICNSVASLTTRALLQQQAFAISLENDMLLIGCASEPTLSLLRKPDKLIHLQKAVDKFYGRPIRIDIIFEKKREGVAPLPAPEPIQPTPQPAVPRFEAAPPAAASVSMSLTPEPVAPTQAEAPLFIPEAPADWMPDLPEEEEASIDLDDEEEEEDEAEVPASAPVLEFRTVASAASDPELAEAKKHAVELLQGRILD